MNRRMILLLLFLSLILLCSCRVRTTLLAPEPPEEPIPEVTAAPEPTDAPAPAPAAEPTPERTPVPTPEPTPEPPPEPTAAPTPEPTPSPAPEEPADQPDAPSEQNEGSERREYAPEASGELTPDAETPLSVPTEEPAETAAPADGGGAPTNTENEGGENTATETLPADEAEQLGVDPAGETADSMQTYYLTLLDSRLGDLFECKRLYVYWETDEDHRTVYKTGLEHRLILGAGAYDVSAKLLEENLTVDDGWVCRKNPDVIVKVVSGGALDTGAAQALCAELAARSDWGEIGAVREKRVLVLSGHLLDTRAGQVAAMVFLAKLMYPEQMEDVDAAEALRELTEEAAGSAYIGTYAVVMGGTG